VIAEPEKRLWQTGKDVGAENDLLNDLGFNLCVALKGAKETISLAQAKDAVPGPNCMLKSLWG